MKTTCLALTAALLAAGGNRPADACDPSAPVIVVPGELDLGRPEPATVVPAAVWLVNTGDEPVELLAARGSCGCTVLDFTPGLLASQAAMQVPIRVTAPKRAGVRRTVMVTFTARGQAPITLPVRLATTGEPLTAAAVRAEPAEVDLGTVAAGTLIRASARLVNTSDQPRRVTAAKPSCTCVTLPDFVPVTIAPGDTVDVHMVIEAPFTLGSTSRDITFVLDNRQVVKVPVRMKTTDDRVETLQRHLADLYSASRTFNGFRVDGDAITAIAWDRDGSRPCGRITCRFNDDGTVRSTLVEPIRS